MSYSNYPAGVSDWDFRDNDVELGEEYERYIDECRANQDDELEFEQWLEEVYDA